MSAHRMHITCIEGAACLAAPPPHSDAHFYHTPTHIYIHLPIYIYTHIYIYFLSQPQPQQLPQTPPSRLWLLLFVVWATGPPTTTTITRNTRRRRRLWALEARWG